MKLGFREIGLNLLLVFLWILALINSGDRIDEFLDFLPFSSFALLDVPIISIIVSAFYLMLISKILKRYFGEF